MKPPSTNTGKLFTTAFILAFNILKQFKERGGVLTMMHRRSTSRMGSSKLQLRNWQLWKGSFSAHTEATQLICINNMLC